MKKRVFKPAICGLLLSVILMSLSGCKLYEDYKHCPTGLFITVKAYATAGGGGVELDDQTIGEVALYVFDESEKYLGRVDTKLNVPTALPFPGYRKLNVVALGNSQVGGHIVSPADGLAASFVQLNATTRAVPCNSPDDLFHTKGYFEGDPKTKQDAVLDMCRTVAEVNVTVRGIVQKIGDVADDYQITIRETAAAIDFNGDLNSDVGIASYKPLASFLGSGDLFTDDFNIFPCKLDEKLTIDILYKGAHFVSGIDKDSVGDDITVAANGKRSILIDLDLIQNIIEVTVVPAEWGTRIPIWTEK